MLMNARRTHAVMVENVQTPEEAIVVHVLLDSRERIVKQVQAGSSIKELFVVVFFVTFFMKVIHVNSVTIEHPFYPETVT